MEVIPKWYRRAKRFILEQRQQDLKKAVARHPNSDRYQLRVDELKEIEEELKVINDI